jgi:hypothetical protein
MRWSEWFFARMGRNHAIALGSLAELLFLYLTEELQADPRSTANAIYDDYESGGRSDKPLLLRPYLEGREAPRLREQSLVPKRQARHLAPR